ncbi:hypothetical protein J3E68DRAFT_406241 [Trichoderma sp. SZMC 28012]
MDNCDDCTLLAFFCNHSFHRSSSLFIDAIRTCKMISRKPQVANGRKQKESRLMDCHASILDIKSMKLGDTGCRIDSFANECDTTDIWVRSNFIDDQFHIILAASSITIPQDLLQVIMDIFCEKIAVFASDPDATLEDLLARRVADSMIPPFPKTHYHHVFN